MANKQSQQPQSSDMIVIMVNGQEIGRAQTLSGTRSFGTEGAYEIGSIMPQEHAVLRFEGNITLDRLRMSKKSLDKLGLIALGEDIVSQGIIDIAVVNKYTGEVIITYVGCTAVSLSEDFNANSFVAENSEWTFLNSRAGS